MPPLVSGVVKEHMLITLPFLDDRALSLSGTWVIRAVSGLGSSVVGGTSGSRCVRKKGIRLASTQGRSACLTNDQPVGGDSLEQPRLAIPRRLFR